MALHHQPWDCPRVAKIGPGEKINILTLIFALCKHPLVEGCQLGPLPFCRLAVQKEINTFHTPFNRLDHPDPLLPISAPPFLTSRSAACQNGEQGYIA